MARSTKHKYLTALFITVIVFFYKETSLLSISNTFPKPVENFAIHSPRNESFIEIRVAVSTDEDPKPVENFTLDSPRNESSIETTDAVSSDEDDDSISDQTKTGSKFEYADSLERFPLSPWLDELMKSQPIVTHNETLADPNEKFIVMTCHKFKSEMYEECGGFTDRLFLLPYYLWLANKTGRRLLVKYSTPFPLEEFLEPPEGGFDWRLPDEFVKEEFEAYAKRSFNEMRDQRRISWHKIIEKPPYNETRFIFANTNLAIRMVGSHFEKVTKENIDEVWPAIFRRMFQPSKPVEKIIDQIAKENDLVPGHYAAAHVRARFPAGRKDLQMNSRREHSGIKWNDEYTRKTVQEIGDNAIKCAVKVMPDTNRVYVASDTYELVRYLVKDNSSWAFTNTSSVRVIARPDFENNARHFNEKVDPSRESPEPFYATFVDLWIYAHSKCMSQGLGGFGHFGSVLSGNHMTCRVRHRNYDKGMLPSCPTPEENRKYFKNSVAK